MSPRPGFLVDLANCTGCKACQVACKDKHDLAPGVLWRRVVEVAGGEWVRRGSLFIDETYTYYMSVACMHCERPICAEVCPTRAMAKGPDGIVAVDADRCMGCRYCEWACPYAAPQFDAAAGVMTKCDLCRDRREEGLARPSHQDVRRSSRTVSAEGRSDAPRPPLRTAQPGEKVGLDPACVAACPMRVLGVADFSGPGDGRDETFPLPPAHLTEPSTSLAPHRDVPRAAAGEPRIGNEEEI